jgi:hypothetical protein
VLNGFDLTCGYFSSNNTNWRAITFGANNIYLTGSGTILDMLNMGFFSWTGTGGFARAYASLSGTFSFGGTSVYTSFGPNVTVTASGARTILNGSFNNITFPDYGTGGGTAFVRGTVTLSNYGSYDTVNGLSLYFYSSNTFATTNTIRGLYVRNGATLTLGNSVWVESGAGIFDANSTFNLNGFSFLCRSFSANDNTAGRALTFGTTGSIQCTATSGSSCDFGTGSGLTTTGAKSVNVAGGSTVVAGSMSEDNVVDFYISGSGGAITLLNTAGETARKVSFNSNFTGTWVGGPGSTIYGDLVTPSNFSAGPLPTSASAITLRAGLGSVRILQSNLAFNCPIVISGQGTRQLYGFPLTISISYGLTFVSGILDANNLNVTVGGFETTTTNVKTLNMGSGTWTIGSNWQVGNPPSMTINASTSTISMTRGQPAIFSGGGHTYYNLNLGAASTFTVLSANTFNSITNSTQPVTLILPASTTTTVTNFELEGTADNLVTVQSSSAGTQATLSKASGTVTANYLSIKDSNATGGAVWRAYESTDLGGNTGWSFLALIVALSTFFLMF